MAYIEKAPKTNIRPAKDSGNTPWSKTSHIFNGDGQQCYKVMYAPSNDSNDLKTVWRENEIVIDGDIYTFVEIGNKWWLQQNVHSTLPFTGTISQINYPRCNKSYYTKERGYAYNIEQAKQIEATLPPKWRIPTSDDWTDLKNTINSLGSKYISTNDGGTDDYGLGFLRCGYNRHNKPPGETGGNMQYTNWGTSFYYINATTTTDDMHTLGAFEGTSATAPSLKTSTGSKYYYYGFLRFCRDKIPFDNV